MGVVYEARRTADDTPVALKTILAVPGAPDRDIDLFLREARILEQLHHPHIVRFLEVGRDGEVIYLAMELLNGRDAGALVTERGPLPIKKAVRIACQMLDGLAHAHAQGVVHRDIKPSNLLIHARDGKKVAKLADFGLARVYEKSRMSGATFQGEIGGTPTYMAPEQITHFHKVQPAADQYSAAATLYTLLTDAQTHDFHGGAVDCLLVISTEDPVPIRERRDSIPKGLAEAIHTALSREPGERFEDVGEFKRRLAEWG
jgi:serine/threonine-protein kinase